MTPADTLKSNPTAIPVEGGAVSAADLRGERFALLELVADGEHFIELRTLGRDERWRKYFRRDPAEADELAARLTRSGDVFVGMLPRLGVKPPEDKQYAAAWVAWVDLDTDRAVRKLALFEPAPTLTVRSGRTDGDTPKMHAYWGLDEPLPPAESKRHNLRLAHHFESDPAVADSGHIMRVPGSRNHKPGGRVARVQAVTGEAHALADLTGELPDSPRWSPENRPRVRKTAGELEALFAGHYADEEGRHEHFRSVVGVLLRRCLGVLPDGALLEVACGWAAEHTHPTKSRDELERNFYNLLERERERKNGLSEFADFIDQRRREL